MKNKQMLLANIPFIISVVILFIVGWLELVAFKIVIPLMFINIGCQQLFVGLRFYKENKKLRIQHILCSILSFVLTILIISKIHRLL
ncbi:hypothetical protein [Clostridium estertheticum]|uniref:hypothetical protein n=1 Tax=Clostridium estertheticum TaxID=238834 RepID=UPI001C0BD5DD|nr:hypothetical protein [Clostridium estertheticum]MBU3171125.1 hypothetical protein [Clostridium estertheticum]